MSLSKFDIQAMNSILDIDNYKEDEDTIYDRCVKRLDEINPLTIEDINGVILDVYLKENKPINLKTIDEYTLCYALKTGIVEKSEITINCKNRLQI